MHYLLAILLVLGGVMLPARGEAMTVTYQIITPDGTTFNLSGTDYKVQGIEGWGMPPLRYRTRNIPQQNGAVVDGVNIAPRTVTVTEEVWGDSRSDYHTNMGSIVEKLSPFRSADRDPLRLRYTDGSGTADLYCYFDGEITRATGVMSATIGFTLTAYDPYWYATTETSTSALCADSLAVSYILGKIDGAWSAMGNSGTGLIYDILVSGTKVYIGGNFTNWDGIANADYIAVYDTDASTWAALGTGMDDFVATLVEGPDGNIYAGGNFTSAGGVANTNYIAYWDGSTWNALSSGFNGNVLDMAFNSSSDLYVVGGFDDVSGGGGNNYNCLAYWDGSSWNAIGSGPGLNGASVYSVAVDANDDVYFGGSFTAEYGGTPDTSDYIVKWDGSNFIDLDGGVNATVYHVRIDNAGLVYIGGIFTDYNHCAVWDGTAWSDLDAGIDGSVFDIEIDAEDNIYFSGDFTSVSGLSLDDFIVRWNGSVWLPLEVDLPGSATVRAVTTTNDGDIYIGFDTTGEALVAEYASVTNSGSDETPPTIEVSGPGTLAVIRNETTGEEIAADLYINDGETVTIDLGDPGDHPTGIAVTSDWAARPNKNNLLGKILNPTALGRFALAADPIASSGANSIGLFVTGNPAESGDNNTQLSRYAGITGIISSNTDAGRLYVSIIDDGGGDYHVNLYSDSARSALVGHTASYSATGSQAITADNDSGLGGTIYVDAVTAADADITVDYALATIKHYNRYMTIHEAVS